jgi:hypothetical protein
LSDQSQKSKTFAKEVTVNNEKYGRTVYNNLNIVEDIKVRRLGWAGHIIRMGE